MHKIRIISIQTLSNWHGCAEASGKLTASVVVNLGSLSKITEIPEQLVVGDVLSESVPMAQTARIRISRAQNRYSCSSRKECGVARAIHTPKVPVWEQKQSASVAAFRGELMSPLCAES